MSLEDFLSKIPSAKPIITHSKHLKGGEMVAVSSDWASHVYYHQETGQIEVSCLKGEKIIYPECSQAEYEQIFTAKSIFRYCSKLGVEKTYYAFTLTPENKWVLKS